MANEAIEVEGLVLEILGGGKYRVKLVDVDMEVEAYAAGKMKSFRIKIIPGDLVTVELNTYEPTKGRIVYRTINKGGKKKSRKSEEVTDDTSAPTSADPKDVKNAKKVKKSDSSTPSSGNSGKTKK